MANYETLKAAIQAVIKTNGNQTITGAVMQSALISMISGLGANMQFAGVATPTTSPGTPDGPTFYLAFQNGTYFNFDKTYLLEKPKVFMWGRPGGPEGAWESVELGVPTMAKYNTDRQLEQNRVDTALAAKANSEDVNNEFTEVRSDLSQKSSMFTGAIMGKGKFYSTAEPLLLDGDMTLRVVFKTGSEVSTPQQITRTTYTNGGMNAAISSSLLSVRASGSRYQFPVLPSTLYELILIKSSDKGSCVLNAVSKRGTEPTEHVDTSTMLLLGADRNDTYRFPGVFISAQIFSFAFSDNDAAASWNGGHPELWRAPDAWRKEDSEQRVVVDLIPASLTPTVWKDISGQGNDIPYVPFDSNPAECEMSYEPHETVEAEYKKSPLYGQQTAALVGGYAGYFMSDSPVLILPDQPTTLIVVFKIGMSGAATIYDVNTTSAGVTSYGEHIDVQSGNYVRISMRGPMIHSQTLPANTKLCMAAISYTPGQPILTRINEYVKESDGVPAYTNPYTPQHVRLGGWSSSYEESKIISVRRFDFAMTKEQLEEAWNGGHPERWKVPDAFSTIGRRWEDSPYSSGYTYYVSDERMDVTNKIPADNGFSVQYQRFTKETSPKLSVYNAFLNDLKRSELKRAWRIEFEYRADAEVILVSNGTDAEPDLRLEANVGNAKRVVFTSLPGKQIALRSNGTYLEIATVKMEQVRAILDLNPQGLTPTVWHDMSSGRNDLHFYRMTTTDNSPEVCELSYENHGFPDTISGDKAPDMHPQFTGQNYIDRANETIYKAVGATAVSKWKPL